VKDSALISSALAALDADGLRAIVREVLPWLDDSARTRLVNALIDRASRGASGWTPPGPSAKLISDAQAFAAAANRTGHAEADEVDDFLRQGMHAFLGKEYPAAYAIFRALLLPVGQGEIDLGQHETLDEVLGVDVAECAAQYVVSSYMTAAPGKRAQAVLAAMDDACSVGHFWNPLREMKQVAVEPLPGFSEFLPQWRRLVEARASNERKNEWETDADRWLSEVVQCLEGSDGLAHLARKTRRTHDLRAWCRASIEARDWPAALAACEEAATLASDVAGARAEFLDDAALAAQELGRPDQPDWMQRAWSAGPTLVRLCRWLGSATSKAVLKDRATRALKTCPNAAHRQRALLHVLLGDLESAADLLATAPGLGWSRDEHPGHVVFWLLAKSLSVEHALLPLDPPSLVAAGADVGAADVIDDPDESSLADARPHLATPDLRALVELADVKRPKSATTRTTLSSALRKAAEKRVAGVTREKRRRHYGHAARLVAACAVVDSTPETAAWVARVRATYRRFHALQGEFDDHMNRR
jgi:hypothetical protein